MIDDRRVVMMSVIVMVVVIIFINGIRFINRIRFINGIWGGKVAGGISAVIAPLGNHGTAAVHRIGGGGRIIDGLPVRRAGGQP